MISVPSQLHTTVGILFVFLGLSQNKETLLRLSSMWFIGISLVLTNSLVWWPCLYETSTYMKGLKQSKIFFTSECKDILILELFMYVSNENSYPDFMNKSSLNIFAELLLKCCHSCFERTVHATLDK